MTDVADDRKKVADLIKQFRFAMLTTQDADGKLVSRPLTVQEAEFDGDLWFLVSKSSSPVAGPAIDREANVALSSDDSWVSLSGTARMVENRQKIDELWNTVVEAWFPGGPDDPDVGVLKFTAESAHYWDVPGGKIAAAFSFVKSKLTGERVDGGDSGTVQL
ncbi:pyridoxamine 5'-phosphate oxidase family protein [Microbacterium sp. ARD32]|uniref:pyridoxamine 5'-phosphate oxidase family protein n=1 Tax=Microbacterium sp. ARD32 TaxID=2962577 RepID=UPI002880D715|nr:pyridoxamine 5'-phosphate oxidase family protein [Microbacterium sp. ARD32]MDT0157638.1 pyridoxamine 5'-phosphate oxidase family protein [Microbacterium sp. ARD32]